ncbi:MAG: DinB family protein [Calditrichaeota bacterium]|nr:DinB family protein [Calditrichota bacterium]MCB9369009.1 DinB family protein [Calditrichota bacterium]
MNSEEIRDALYSQFGATLDMLENAILACPDDVWSNGEIISERTWWEFWYLASHTLFWTDFYLSETIENFTPPKPFGLEERDPAGVLPPRVYTQKELLTYLEHDRRKMQEVFRNLTGEKMSERFIVGKKNFSVVEKLLYTMRHIQHHTAQLNLLLRQSGHEPPTWVTHPKQPLTQ